MGFVLGLDGGGSKVACLASTDKGRLLGYGRGGPVNINYVLYQEAIDSATHAINNALQQSGLRGDQVDLLVLSAPMDPASLEEVGRRCNLKKMQRAAEGETSRWAVRYWIDQRVGVTVDAGTGSLSRGWALDGRESGAGGFGATLGDEGSGVWISVKAMSAVLQAYDGRMESTGLTKVILEHFNLPAVQDLIFCSPGGYVSMAKMIELKKAREHTRFSIDSGHILEKTSDGISRDSSDAHRASQGGLFFRQFRYDEPLTRSEVARLCPLVVEVARQGDRIALQILKEAGIELGRLATAVIQRLGMQAESFAIVPFGGVFKAGELILEPFRQTCLATAPGATITLPRFEPEVGAILIALAELGVSIDAPLLATIESSSHEFPMCRWKGGILDE